jgi:hypothetical protein
VVPAGSLAHRFSCSAAILAEVRQKLHLSRCPNFPSQLSFGPLNRAHRRRFLLSGLLVCGCCGAGYTIMAKDRYGCAGQRSKGTCQNHRTISRQEIEARILKALKQNLLTPELVAEFARAYQEEVNRLVREASGRTAEFEAKLAGAQRKIDGIMRAIEDGLYQPSMKARLAELEAEKAALFAQQARSGAPPNISSASKLGVRL